MRLAYTFALMIIGLTVKTGWCEQRPLFLVTDQGGNALGKGYLEWTQEGKKELRIGEKAYELTGEPIQDFQSFQTVMTVKDEGKHTTCYAPYQKPGITQLTVSGHLLWAEEIGVIGEVVPALTTLATQALGNDPWHCKKFETSVVASVVAASITGEQNFEVTTPATFGTRCILASNVNTWNNKPVKWLGQNTFGATPSGNKPHQKEIVGLIEWRGSYLALGLLFSTGGTSACGATTFPCTEHATGFGKGGRNLFGRLFS